MHWSRCWATRPPTRAAARHGVPRDPLLLNRHVKTRWRAASKLLARLASAASPSTALPDDHHQPLTPAHSRPSAEPGCWEPRVWPPRWQGHLPGTPNRPQLLARLYVIEAEWRDLARWCSKPKLTGNGSDVRNSRLQQPTAARPTAARQVVLHPQWGSAVYPASIFTQAPQARSQAKPSPAMPAQMGQAAQAGPMAAPGATLSAPGSVLEQSQAEKNRND